MNTLETLKQVADLIALQFGNNCEVVIHKVNLEESDSTLVYVKNGHISSRNVGDGPSHIVYEALKKNDKRNNVTYLTKTKDQKVLKSSSLFIKNDKGEIEYIFGINYNINELILADELIRSFINIDEEEHTDTPERITQNVVELLDDLLEESVRLIGKPVALMSKEDKIAAIEFLNEAGAFLITKSGDKIAKFFGVSKYTLYNYVDVNKQTLDKVFQRFHHLNSEILCFAHHQHK